MSQQVMVLYTCFLAILSCLTSASAQPLSISVPDENSHVKDLAQLVNAEDLTAINAICNDLQTQREIPMFVVTIESMASQGAADTSIESFAWDLFEQWGVDPEFAAAPHWRHGILFLISKNDRRARIELGMDWGPEHTQGTTDIMNRIIVPSFKSGEFSTGILKGVTALESLDRLEPGAVPAVSDGSPMLKFLGMSALMLAGFGLLYGALIFLASKIPQRVPKLPAHATPDYSPQSGPWVSPQDDPMHPLYENDLRRPRGIFPSPADTSTSAGPSGFDSSSGGFDSGGGFSDGGGATGSW